jgi:magnesium-protoporphyrin IX monomethyl ester (oxidative) cyclase
MARDEARHAGFINDALREAGIAVNLGFLTQKKKYTYFRPKFIYYATYLSREDRLRPLHHDLPPPGGEPGASVPPDLQVVQGMVQRRVLPRGGLRAPDEDRSEADGGFVNKLWIKFFLTAVYSTMYVRDHQRPAFHAALGVDPDWYAHEVFTKTSEISKQVFPLTLDIDHPRWQKGLKAATGQCRTSREAKKSGNVLKRVGASARAAVAFVSLYTIPAKQHRVPAADPAGARLLMLHSPWIAALIALFLWWFSTGAILLAVRRADKEGAQARLWAVLWNLPVLILGGWASSTRCTMTASRASTWRSSRRWRSGAGSSLPS